MQNQLAKIPIILVILAVASAPALGTPVQNQDSRTADIRITQEGLRIKGYRPGPVDGACGPRTLAAMRRYAQSSQDIGGGNVTCADAERYSYLFQKEMGPKLARSLGIDIVTPNQATAAVSKCSVRWGRIVSDIGLARHTAIEHWHDSLRLQVAPDSEEILCWLNFLERVRRPSSRASPRSAGATPR